jgi:hypothetical protein
VRQIFESLENAFNELLDEAGFYTFASNISSAISNLAD